MILKEERKYNFFTASEAKWLKYFIYCIKYEYMDFVLKGNPLFYRNFLKCTATEILHSYTLNC